MTRFVTGWTEVNNYTQQGLLGCKPVLYSLYAYFAATLNEVLMDAVLSRYKMADVDPQLNETGVIFFGASSHG